MKKIIKDSLLCMLIFLTAVLISFGLKLIDKSDFYVPLLFVLAVFLISRFTEGYIYGILSSVVGVFCVNYIFTYPYFEFNFTISGYPLTFATMLVVSIITSALTTRIKEQEKIQMEAEKEKMYANLLRSVSHDIRTPLTSIIGSAQTIVKNSGGISDEKRNVLMNNIIDESNWLMCIVENLLSITRIGADKTDILKNDEAAEEIIGETAAKFRKRFPGIQLKLSVPEELLIVPMDAVLIEQVLSNLMENAVFHGVTTTMICLSASKKGENAVFKVSDDGKGLKPEEISSLFSGGKIAGKNQSQDKHRNMGIGLCVCNTIIKAHGGEMTARNLSSGGAEFTFTLPLKAGTRND